MFRNIFSRQPSRRRRPKPKKSRGIGSRVLEQSSFIGRSQVKYILYGIFFLVLGILFYVIVILVRAYVNWHLDNPTVWDGQTKLNILLVGMDQKQNDYNFADLIIVVSVNPSQQKVGIFSVDPDIIFTAPDNQSINLRKSYNLILNDSNSINNIKYGVEQSLALDIDKYVIITESSYLEMQDLLGSVEVNLQEDLVEEQYTIDGEALLLKKGRHSLKGEELLGLISSDERGASSRLELHNNVIGSYINKLNSYKGLRQILFHLDLLNNIETDFSKTELFRLYRFLSKINSADLRSGHTKQSSLQDMGQEGKQPLLDRIDKDVQSIFLDTNVLKEQSRLEVLNGTNQPGIAARYARFFDNTGIRVVRSGNAIRPTHNTTLYVPDEARYPYTITDIVAVFDGNISVVEEEYKYKHVGDMVLVIGTDFIDF